MRSLARLRVSWIAAASLLFIAGCSSSDDGEGPVGPDALACYTGGLPPGAREEGTIEIGTGLSAYEPVEEGQTLPLIAGPQGGVHLDIRPRIRGLHPGEPGNNRNPENPYTLVSAYDEAGDRLDVHTCGFTLPYRPHEDDFHELGFSRRLMFPPEVANEYDGERLQIVAEVFDAEGRYARVEVWVVAEVREGLRAEPDGRATE